MSARRQTVSACVIARDEEVRLPDCLRSVAFCDQLVVVDGGSSDRTVAVARAAGATVLENPWPGFAVQRNVAIDHADGDWILEVDADERVTGPLRAEIEAFLSDPPDVDVGGLPMCDVFLGAEIRRAAKYPKYRYRLFRRGSYRHDESRTVHEGLWANGRAWAFEGELVHLLAMTWREALADVWRYARLEARHLPPAPPGWRAYAMELVVRPASKFAYRLAVDGGWADGWRGVAKITLDCSSDVLIGLRRPRASAADLGSGEHFGQRTPRIGSVRLLALAAGAPAAASATPWLRAAADAGADVGLVTDAPPPTDRAVHVRGIERWSALRVVRALEAEDQLRPADALVPFGRRARRMIRIAPGRLRRELLLLDPDVGPVEAERRVRGAARGPRPGARGAAGGPG